ncbi:hypothetical protein [Pinirhizobacter sp.]|uniref:hypothetical protein n=1 Tax=Pinirhizobacter sp. TaxID=2950432 RepID=UPI002D1FA3A7|nr:hypothetical protein [Pinirhizobacter sp.]
MEENEIYVVVGEVMVLSARIEACLESCITACLPEASPIASGPVLRRLNFTNQIAILNELVQGLYNRRDTTLVEFRRWLRRLKRIRGRRNDLVHQVLKAARSCEDLGRWKSEIERMREECTQAPHWAQALRTRQLIRGQSLCDSGPVALAVL